MPFIRPTLTELNARAQSDLNGRLPGADSRLRRSLLGALASVHAGAVHGLYGYLDWLARQILPDTAEAEVLERHAAIWGVTRKPATSASGAVLATGQNGAIIPAGAVLQRGQGVEYEVRTAASIVGGQATLQLIARQPGLAHVAPTGARLQFVSPVAGVQAQATVSAPGLAGGADEEPDDLLRERLLARIRQAPAGGARHDYQAWALASPEVTRAWVYPGWTGDGTVGVAVMMDGRPDPLPQPGDLARVLAELQALAPVTAEVVVFAPVAKPLNIVFQVITPDSPAVRDAIRAEIVDLLFREAAPGGTILVSRLREAISLAAGEGDHVLVSPVANIAHQPSELAVLGAIDWDGP